MKKTVFWSALIMAFLLLVSNGAQAKSLKKGLMAKVGFDLANLYKEYEAYVTEKESDEGFKSSNTLLPVFGNQVIIDAVTHGKASILKSELKGLGMKKASEFGRVVSGHLPISAIKSMASLASLIFARPAYAITNAGVVTSQGDQAMLSNFARDTFQVDGAGVTVGVLSDSFDCQGGASASVSNDDLPEGIVVLAEDPGCSSGSDEGRAMMEIIHDVAPGTSLAFHTAFNGQADFASGIQELAELGADVIVDDVIYFAEPMFQDGIIAQAVDSVVNQGISYFSSAGNQSRNAYQDPFYNAAYIEPGSLLSYPGAPPFYGGFIHSFGKDSAGNDIVSQEIIIPAGTTLIFSFQWDDPFLSVCGNPGPGKKCRGADTDMDIYLLDQLGAFIIAGGVDTNIGGDPVELLGVINTGSSDTLVNLIIVKYDGPDPELMKYVRFGGDLNLGTENSGTIYGHSNAEMAEAVGAAFYDDTPGFGATPPLLEAFSSGGSTPILFDKLGKPIGPVVRPKPEIVGPDGVNTTFFGDDISFDGDIFPNFFGTSASAPHAAAVAALMIQANPLLLPEEVYEALEDTAVDMNTPGFDDDSGYGFIQADQALSAVSASPGITVTPISGLTTTEAGGSATFEVVLDTLPSADVTIALSSSNTDEGIISSPSPPSLTFTPDNGTTPQTVTVTGINDDSADGDVAYFIITQPAISSDSRYHGIDPADVSVVNLDNDGAEGTMHVAVMTENSSMQGKKWWKTAVTIQVVDANDAPVSEATVTGDWNNGITETASCTTDAAGQCSVNLIKIIQSVSSVTFSVTNISHTTLTYDQTENDVTEITVNRP